MNYFLLFLAAFSLSLVLTLVIKLLAAKVKIVDKPNKTRKIHKQAVPLLGGTAIFLSFFLLMYFVRSELLAGNLVHSHWIGFFVGACFLMLGGLVDDKYNLKPSHQMIFPLLAAISVVIGGVNIEKITNPLGGYLFLDTLKIPLGFFMGKALYFVLISDSLVILWLMGMMYTTKLLDGIDGLVTGVTAIGAFIIFLFTMTTQYFQPDIGLSALVLAGACLGFLIFNWHPAKIFLGEGGSLFLGYALGVLAIISGGKIAIALLVMGIPIMDVIWTILRRLRSGQHPFKFADRKHLHHRLLDAGLTQRQTTLVYYFLATLFGLSAVFLQSLGKLFALGLLVIIMLIIIVGFSYLEKRKRS